MSRDWKKYLHEIRRREVEIVFSYFKEKKFQSGLEVGAGDGYQTRLLSEHCEKFISSDLNFNRIKEELKLPRVVYIQCDADNLAHVFDESEFDFIFSSNVLEHMSNPGGFLSVSRTFLQTDGYAVHIIPSRMLKISYIALHYINLSVLVMNRLGGLFQGKKIFRGNEISFENNINKNKVEKSGRFSRIFFPQIHGNFNSHTEEFSKFGRKSWEKLFFENGYTVEKYIQGPAFSGYGFGFKHLRRILECVGWSSEHIFILKKHE